MDGVPARERELYGKISRKLNLIDSGNYTPEDVYRACGGMALMVDEPRGNTINKNTLDQAMTTLRIDSSSTQRVLYAWLVDQEDYIISRPAAKDIDEMRSDFYKAVGDEAPTVANENRWTRFLFVLVVLAIIVGLATGIGLLVLVPSNWLPWVAGIAATALVTTLVFYWPRKQREEVVSLGYDQHEESGWNWKRWAALATLILFVFGGWWLYRRNGAAPLQQPTTEGSTPGNAAKDNLTLTHDVADLQREQSRDRRDIDTHSDRLEKHANRISVIESQTDALDERTKQQARRTSAQNTGQRVPTTQSRRILKVERVPGTNHVWIFRQ